MKRLLLFTTVLLLTFGCSSSKKVVDASSQDVVSKADPAIGVWIYTITGLPDGDTSGKLIISKEGNAYQGSISSELGDVDLNECVIEGNKLTKGVFEAQGFEVELSGIFEATNFTGKLFAAGFEFPVTAVKE